MNKKDLIEAVYLEAVKGIQKDWLSEYSTKWYEYIIDLPHKEKVTYLITIFHNQVFNGGFHQYFVNGYGQFVDETIKALQEINAVKRAKLLESSFNLVNPENQTIEVFRKLLLEKKIEPLFIMDALYEPLDKLDDEYYDVEDEEIDELLGNYLTENN